MDKSDIFTAKNYQDYLIRKAGPATQRRGIKSAMAQAIGCQPTYITHLLAGKANLSLEQAEVLNTFFAHTKEESQFFLLLVSRDRAGTHSLKSHFQEQLDQILKHRMVLTKRLGQKNTLTQEQRSVFYSAWYFLAAQIALTIPALQTQKMLSKKLGLSMPKAGEILQFLSEIGLITKMGDHFHPTETQIRLGNDSHQIIQHHTNWRVKAIESLTNENADELHYSGVISLSSKDVIKIKNQLLEQLKENIEIIKESKEERLFVMNIDFFNLEKDSEI